MKSGLVLEGGAMRGLFTAGVLDAWMEAGIVFDGAVGVSAGACFGCNYKSRQPGRVIRYNRRFAKDARYCSWWSLFRTGNLFNEDFCYRAGGSVRRAFDDLFVHRPFDAAGSGAYRWAKTLERLDQCDPAHVAAALRAAIDL